MRTGLLARAMLLLSPLFLLPAGLFLLSGGEERYRYPSPPRETRRLVIASPQWEGIRYEFEEGFRRWLYEHDGVGVEVTWLEQGGGSKTLRWIEEKYAARKEGETGIGVDVLFGGGTDPYETLKAKGLLERHDPPEETMVESRLPRAIGGFPLYDPDRFWFGTCLTGFGIIVNARVLAAMPERFGDLVIRDWASLADPRLAGWVGSADPRSSSSYHTFFEIVLQQPEGFASGMRLLREIGGNVATYTKFSQEIPKFCAVGECAAAPTIDQYALAQIEKVDAFLAPGDAPALTFFLPEGRTLVNADAAGILLGAPNRATARRFIDFLLSDDAGYLWMLARGARIDGFSGPRRHGLNRATVLPGVFHRIQRDGLEHTLVRQNPFRMSFDFHYDYPLAAKRWTLINDLLGALLIDTRGELARAIAAWRGLEGERKAEAEAVLFSLPVTEERMREILDNEWNDPVRRERFRIEWTAFARARYELVAGMRAAGGDG